MRRNPRAKDNSEAVDAFLASVNLLWRNFDAGRLLEDYLAEMNRGLSKSEASSLRMIPSYLRPTGNVKSQRRALALDAGGTNLRAGLFKFGEDGIAELEEHRSIALPGASEECSAKDFMRQVAELLIPFLELYYTREKQKLDTLGFCFSYPIDILFSGEKDLDAKLIAWTKEIKVPELIGQNVGSLLLETCKELCPSYAPDHIKVVNDTVATLFAGLGSQGDYSYSDYVGYILGTGINSCYIENSLSVAELDSNYMAPRVIINMEAGNYACFPRSEVDLSYDQTTNNPGVYQQEKACSGRYFGELATFVLREAGSKGLLPAVFSHLPLQDSRSINQSLCAPHLIASSSQLSPFQLWLREQGLDEDSLQRVYLLLDALMERSALFTAVNIAACISASGQGLSPLQPVCVTVDGSSFYAYHEFPYKVDRHLKKLLSGDNLRYYRLVQVENAPLLGAAMVSLS